MLQPLNNVRFKRFLFQRTSEVLFQKYTMLCQTKYIIITNRRRKKNPNLNEIFFNKKSLTYIIILTTCSAKFRSSKYFTFEPTKKRGRESEKKLHRVTLLSFCCLKSPITKWILSSSKS